MGFKKLRVEERCPPQKESFLFVTISRVDENYLLVQWNVVFLVSGLFWRHTL